MGTLWTPSGEHVPRPEGESEASGAPGAGAAGPATGEPGGAGAGGTPRIKPEQVVAVREMHEQVRATPAVGLVAEHVVALCEYALVYLGIATPPDDAGNRPGADLAQAGVCIDAAVALVDGMGARLAPHEQQLRQVLTDVQRLYVEVAEAQPSS
jgi:hypothetical protein